MEKLLTIEEVSKVLRISISCIYKLASQQRIPVVRINNKLLFSEDQLEDWIKRHTIQESKQ